MSGNIYPIQLLNDLHNYFPDVLYNPGRFRNIQDLLEYIRSVADVNPYTRGLRQYNHQYHVAGRANELRPAPRSNIGTPMAAAPAIPTVPLNRTYINSTAVPNPSLASRFLSGDNVPITLRTTVIDGDTVPLDIPLNMPTGNIMSALITQLFGDALGGINSTVPFGNLAAFLDQRVPVTPSAAQIADATLVSTAARTLDEICTICQDQIEANQQVRRIIHCQHSFHKDCIDTWFRGNVHCPTCRHDIREVQGQTNTDSQTAPPPVPENHRRMAIRRNDNT